MREDVDAVFADYKSNNPVDAPLQRIMEGFPYEIVGIDIKGPLPKPKVGIDIY